MKTGYIILIVLMCAIPILIVTGYGVYKLLETPTTKLSPTTTATPPATELSPMTTVPTLTPAYRWVNYTIKLWNDTRLVELARDEDNSIVIAHSIYNNGDEIPSYGVINLSNGTLFFPNSVNINYTNFEVLQIERGETTWSLKHNGTIPDNAIEGGKIKNETVYVCRIDEDYEQNYDIGWIQPNNHSCIADKKIFKDYDLLLHKMEMIR